MFSVTADRAAVTVLARHDPLSAIPNIYRDQPRRPRRERNELRVIARRAWRPRRRGHAPPPCSQQRGTFIQILSCSDIKTIF
jgi:hypothetical protein